MLYFAESLKVGGCLDHETEKVPSLKLISTST